MLSLIVQLALISPVCVSVCVCTYACVLVIQSCLTLCDHMDCSLTGSSVHGTLQARILEWVATPFTRGSSWPRDQTRVFCIADRFFTNWVTKEAPTLLVPKTVGKLFTRKGFISTLLELPGYLSFSGNLKSIKVFPRIFTAGMLLWLSVCKIIQAMMVSQGSAGWEGRPRSPPLWDYSHTVSSIMRRK